MSFSCEDNERYNDALVALAEGKYDALTSAYAGMRFKNETARAFASEGFLRRFELMKHCILGSMEPFPRRISGAPDAFSIRDAVIHLQAFGVNVRSCTDNLAHSWVLEKGLTGEDGALLAGPDVGFGPRHEAVLDSLSPGFAAYLRDLGPWFDYLDRFRHALEHHVPLYVPADTVSQETLQAFAEMGQRIGNAERGRDHDEADRLTREGSALVSFFPIIGQAFGEDAHKGAFQFQMMTDLETVGEVAQRLHLEFA